MELIDQSSSIGIWQIILLLVAFTLILLPVIALISILKNDFKGSDKLIWILVSLLLPFFGPVLYFIIGRKSRIKNI